MEHRILFNSENLNALKILCWHQAHTNKYMRKMYNFSFLIFFLHSFGNVFSKIEILYVSIYTSQKWILCIKEWLHKKKSEPRCVLKSHKNYYNIYFLYCSIHYTRLYANICPMFFFSLSWHNILLSFNIFGQRHTYFYIRIPGIMHFFLLSH